MNLEKFNPGENHIPSNSIGEVAKWEHLQNEKEKVHGRVVITGGTEGIGKEIAL